MGLAVQTTRVQYSPLDYEAEIARMHARLMEAERERDEALVKLDMLQLLHGSGPKERRVEDAQCGWLTRGMVIVLAVLAVKGRLVSKDTMMRALEHYGDMTSENAKILDVYICKIRQRLAQHNIDVRIKTVWGRGWQIEAETLQAARALLWWDAVDTPPQSAANSSNF